jgi:hypothetical protein
MAPLSKKLRVSSDTLSLPSELRARVRLMSDDQLRSEYVSACHPWTDTDLVSLELREAIEREAKRRGLKLRTRAETVAAMVQDMKGF